MKIILFFAVSLCLFSKTVWAKQFKLVYGGKINIDEREWEVVDTKAMFENIPQSFVHRKHPDLKGWLMGGTPDSVAKCSKTSPNLFQVCVESATKEGKAFHQIIFSRKIDQKTYQNYLISFSFIESLSKTYAPLVKSFIADIERSKK